MYYSETAKVRPYVLKYCLGRGVDIGCGIEKIKPEAIGVDFAVQYNIDDHPVTAADFTEGFEKFFEQRYKNEFDFIFSSHLLEDYSNFVEVLLFWSQYVNPHGYIVLVLPVEELYRKKGENCNARHVNNFASSLHFFSLLPENAFTLVDCSDSPIGEYSFYVVLKKNG